MNKPMVMAGVSSNFIESNHFVSRIFDGSIGLSELEIAGFSCKRIKGRDPETKKAVQSK